VPVEDRGLAQRDDANARVARRLGRRLPRLDDVGGESRTLRTLFGDRLVAEAVVADARGLDEDRWPIVSPARWTTASTPASRSASIVPAAGSQAISCSTAGARRTSVTTSWPASCSAGTSALPISPDAPVTATFMAPVSQPEAQHDRCPT